MLLDRMDEAVAALQDYLDNPGASKPDSNYYIMLEFYQSVASGDYVSNFYFGRATTLRDTQSALSNDPQNTTFYALQGSILMDLGRNREHFEEHLRQRWQRTHSEDGEFQLLP